MEDETIINQLIKSIANSEAEQITLQPGDVIIKEKDSSDQVFFLLSGRLGVWLKGIKLNQINKGEIFGELAFMMRTERTATVIAELKSVVVIFPRSLIEKTLQNQPIWFQLYIKVLIQKVCDLSEEVSSSEYNRKKLVNQIQKNDTVGYHLKKMLEIIFNK